MVAGMVMPLVDLRAIYELLFRDGVMVTKKDKRPQCMHPEIPAVSNLKVIRAMGSLKSRGFVRETFAWKHAYYYLTNEGIVFLRDYLRLPPEIVPSSLQRIRRPASTLDVMRRAARVQTVEGPTSYVPKPGGRGESQEGMMDRQGYRHKRGPGSEEEAPSDKPPMRFRGSYQPRGPAGEPGVQTQTFFRRGQGFRRGEERGVGEEQGQRRGDFRTSYLPPESRAVRSLAPDREVKPPTPEVPVAPPVEPEIFQEEAVPVAAPIAVEAVEPAFLPEEEPEPVTVAPAPVVENVVEKVEELVEKEEEEVGVAEEFEEVVAEPPMCCGGCVVEVEPVVVEAIAEEHLEETPVVLEEEESEAESEESEAPEPAEVIEEEEVIEAAHVEEVEEEPQPAAAAPDEPVEQEVVVEDAHVEEASIKDLPQETEIEIVEEAGDPLEQLVEELVEEPAAEPEPIMPAVSIEAESTPVPVAIAEAIEVETDIDLPTPPPPATEDFTGLSENHVETVVQHITHQMPTLNLTPETSYQVTQEVVTMMEPTLNLTPETSYQVTQEVVTMMEPTLNLTPETSYQVTQEVVTMIEEPVNTNFVSQSHSIMTTSVAVSDVISEFGLEHKQTASPKSDFAVPAVPSECPIAALKSSLPQGDWGFLTEDPEEEQEVKKVWPDSIEG